METKLKCPVCKNLLAEPVLLSCEHIICRNCLPGTSTVDEKKQACPVLCSNFRLRDARGSLHLTKIIKTLNKMDGDISGIVKPIVSDKTPILEENEKQAIANPPDLKEMNRALVSSKSCKKYEANMSRSARSKSNMCCEKLTGERAKSTKRRREEDRIITGSKKGSNSTYNQSNSTKFETYQEDIKLRVTPINMFPGECEFCHMFRSNELFGPIVCYVNGVLVKPEEAADEENAIYVHEKCVNWAPNIYHLDDKVMNLEEEIERGEKLLCSRCAVKGTVLGCSYGPCRRTYHAACALQIDCTWDSVHFKMLCPTHKDEKIDGFIPDDRTDGAATLSGRLAVNGVSNAVGSRDARMATDHVLFMVKSYLRYGVDNRLGDEALRKAARRAAYTVLAACGFKVIGKHKRLVSKSVSAPDGCISNGIHSSEPASDLLAGSCLACFDSFVRDVIVSILNRQA